MNRLTLVLILSFTGFTLSGCLAGKLYLAIRISRRMAACRRHVQENCQCRCKSRKYKHPAVAKAASGIEQIQPPGEKIQALCILISGPHCSLPDRVCLNPVCVLTHPEQEMDMAFIYLRRVCQVFPGLEQR